MANAPSNAIIATGRRKSSVARVSSTELISPLFSRSDASAMESQWISVIASGGRR